MTNFRITAARLCACLATVALLAACATTPTQRGAALMFSQERSSDHRGSDDLLSGGLGLEGLRAMETPAFADAEHPTSQELRRRALWTNWRGIADLSPGGGFGDIYGSLGSVPGREFTAFAHLPGARQPHRVMLQLPDNFDTGKRCVVVTASSGSRGIYGAIAVAGAWGLPKGCAVAYTDKGNGTDYFDLDAGMGIDADGEVAAAGANAGLAFTPSTQSGQGVVFKHAHSQDNPEADWGRHVKQAADFALAKLNEALPAQAPFTFANTRVIAVGLSNGGGAVLRAAELDGIGPDRDWLDAVVAGEPNVLAEGHGARSLFDYGTEAALLMPCALPQLGMPAMPGLEAKCAALTALGVLAGVDYEARQKDALAKLHAGGWTDAALRAGSISVAYDLWRALGATYASAYGRYPPGEHPCGFRFSAIGPGLTPRAASAAERAAWVSESSGIPPGAGVGIVDPRPLTDMGLTGLNCMRALWTGDGEDAHRVRKGIAEITAKAPRIGLPVMVVHGIDDGLVPQAFTSAPYVAMAKAAGRNVRYWQVRNVQHLDAFLGFPQYGAVYLPLLPYVYTALDRIDAYLDGKDDLPADAVIATVPRAGKPLTVENLAMPR